LFVINKRNICSYSQCLCASVVKVLFQYKYERGELKEMLLKTGESAKWIARNNFPLKIGNAGGIKVVFDGKESSPLGAEGQVVRPEFPGPKSR